MKEALVVGRHQFAMPVKEALGADQEEGVIERPRSLVLALIHYHHTVDKALAAHLGKAFDVRPVDVDRVLPKALPELIPLGEGDRAMSPRPRWVYGHERLGQNRELDAVVGRGVQ
jgi:hypothetical protein